jgi:COPII coat assembly protein SEC16
MSNASSIDDLLGPPTARKGTAKKAKKGRGYIDVMGEKAST